MPDDDEVLGPLEGARQALADQVVVVDEHDGLGLGLVRHRSAFTRGSGRGLGAEGDRHDGSPRAREIVVLADREPGVDPLGTLAHDAQAVGVRTGRAEPAAVVADLEAGEGRLHPAVHPDVAGVRVLAGVGDRLLRDAQQLGLGLGAEPGGCLVEGEVHGQVGAGSDRVEVVGEGGAQAGRRHDVAAQVEDREPELADHAGELPAQRRQPGPLVLGLGGGGEVVDEVAEGGDLLGDPVVDLAGQAPALLHRGEGAHLLEGERGVEPDALRVELLHQVGRGRPVETRHVRQEHPDHPRPHAEREAASRRGAESGPATAASQGTISVQHRPTTASSGWRRRSRPPRGSSAG